MKFKEWIQKESVVGTSVLNGGIGEAPGQNLNTPSMPVRSKISTNDGASPPQDAENQPDPDVLFGFKKKRDRKSSGERAAQTIDIGRRFPLNRTNPASIGFSQ
jgi:hypothetical protein